MSRQVDAPSHEQNTFATKSRRVTRERRLAGRPDDAMARNAWIRAVAHRIPDRACRMWSPREHADEAIRRDAAGRDLSDDRVHAPRPGVGHRRHTARP